MNYTIWGEKKFKNIYYDVLSEFTIVCWITSTFVWGHIQIGVHRRDTLDYPSTIQRSLHKVHRFSYKSNIQSGDSDCKAIFLIAFLPSLIWEILWKKKLHQSIFIIKALWRFI